METKAEGSCQCGRIRYRLSGALPPAYACHCGECKKQSASAFSLSMVVEFASLSVTGDVACFETTAYSGAVKYCYFCPMCGTRMWHRSSSRPQLATLKVGTLDGSASIAPRGHLWVSQLQAGITLDLAVPAFDTQPDDINAWREGLK